MRKYNCASNSTVHFPDEINHVISMVKKRSISFPNGFRITFLLTAFFAACDTIKKISLEKMGEKVVSFFTWFFFF